MNHSLENNNLESSIFIDFLNLLEGYKTRIKNLHWSASNLNIHKQLDKLLSFVSDYQDELAEEYMGITEILDPLALQGSECLISDPLELLDTIVIESHNFYESLSDDIEYVGIVSELESFIQGLNKFKYLFKLSI